jgi:hypothetical protein
VIRQGPCDGPEKPCHKPTSHQRRISERPTDHRRYTPAKYDYGMKPVKATTRIAALLLCFVIAWLSVSSPHCDLCDGPHATILSSLHPVINHPAPVEPDICNGVCSCCGFHWLPDPDPVLSFIHTVSSASPAEAPSPLRMPRPSPFRPPRTAVSS